MALLWIDGFESYGTTIALTTAGRPAPTGVVGRRYSISDHTSQRIQPGRFDARSLYFQNTSAESLRTPPVTTDTTIIVGLAVKRDGALASVYPIRLFDDGNVGIQVSLDADSTKVAVRKGGDVLEIVEAGILPGAWYFLELKVFTHPTEGSYEVRVDGETITLVTDINTVIDGGLGYYDQVGFNTLSSSGAMFCIDDLYICDGTGAINNDFLGNQHVATLRPTGDHTANFTTVEPVGDHCAAVDEIETDDNASYIEGVDGDKDLYEYEDLPADSKNIKGLQVHTMTRVTGTNYYDLKTVVLSDATEDADAGQLVASTDWLLKSRIVEEDPNTSALWLPAAIDAARFGLLAEDA